MAAAKRTIALAKVLLAQLEVPVPAVHLALRLAKAGGARTVLDPAPAVPLPENLLNLVDVIRPNASEAETLTGVQVKDRISAERAARVLLGRGVRAVVVQAGHGGDLLVTADEARFLPRLQVESVDATGAGDAFAAAALATTKLVAQAGLPRREEVLELFRTSRRRR